VRELDLILKYYLVIFGNYMKSNKTSLGQNTSAKDTGYMVYTCTYVISIVFPCVPYFTRAVNKDMT